MFAGKTEELLRRLVRAQIARVRVLAFKPSMDVRYGTENITTHSGHSIPCTNIDTPAEIHKCITGQSVIGIDEVQFFDNNVVDVVNSLANDGHRVIVSGLDRTSFNEPFGPIPLLLTHAERVTKLSAVCQRCGADAHFSKRMVLDDDKIMLGGTDCYEARCRTCWKEP